MDSSARSRQQVDVGLKIREIRTRKGFSLRLLAQESGLNINTLSLIENGKTSPSVSTLQTLASALQVPIVAFFENEPVKENIVFTPLNHGTELRFGSTSLIYLSEHIEDDSIQTFKVKLPSGAGSGNQMVVHTGVEFIYCLTGSAHYRIAAEEYMLTPGDSLIFEAYLPHCWENMGDSPAELLLMFISRDQKENPGESHFRKDLLLKEIFMKIAVITDDGKTISKHFGRAAYYMVVTIEGGKEINRELREKPGHQQFHTQGQEEHQHPEGQHGFDPASHTRHSSMAQVIADCKVLICGGMGMGAYSSLQALNIQPVVTDLDDVDGAVQAFLDGKLIDHTELLH